jgi:hypothetical protein
MDIRKVTSQTIQGKLKKNCIFSLKTKRMHAYKQGPKKPKWKAPRGSKAKTMPKVKVGEKGQEKNRKDIIC